MHAARILFFLLFISVCGCNTEAESVTANFKNNDGSASPSLSLELALSREQQSLGLMYRKEMDPHSGMLFVFPNEEPRSFWMKNTYLSLDIIYINADKKVVSIIYNAKPLRTDKLPSDAPAKYVVEVLGGMSKKWGVVKGSEFVVEGW